MLKKIKLDSKEIGKRLKEARRAVDLTQGEMGKLCGFPHSAVSEMEKGIRRAQLKYLLLLVSEFNINLNWIFTGKGLMFTDFEVKRDFGEDNEIIKYLFHLLESSSKDRFTILQFISDIKDSKEKQRIDP